MCLYATGCARRRESETKTHEDRRIVTATRVRFPMKFQCCAQTVTRPGSQRSEEAAPSATTEAECPYKDSGSDQEGGLPSRDPAGPVMGPLQEGHRSLLRMTPLTLEALDHVTRQPTTRDGSNPRNATLTRFRSAPLPGASCYICKVFSGKLLADVIHLSTQVRRCCRALKIKGSMVADPRAIVLSQINSLRGESGESN